MSEREFENYLTLLASLLRLSGAQREAVSSELRDHLQERVAHLVQQGVAREEAVQQATKPESPLPRPHHVCRRPTWARSPVRDRRHED